MELVTNGLRFPEGRDPQARCWPQWCGLSPDGKTLYAAETYIGERGISAISRAGELVEFVGTDDILTTNICFGGNDMMDAWLCLSATGRLVKTRRKRPGLKLEYLNK